MDASSRLRPYTESNNTSVNKVTFQKGEKVEAVWSSDGQRYPGTIVHVYPNGDNYEVLFNDGVKSRKKANQIFNLKQRRQGRPLTKNSSSPAQVPEADKLLPPVVASKCPDKNQVSSELNSTTTTVTVEKIDGEKPISSETEAPNQTDDSPNGAEDTDCKTTAVVSTTVATIDDSNPSISTRKIPILQPQVSTEGSDLLLLSSSSSPSDISSTTICTKKGFVYVQQPHYSVFDQPPTELGKRRRRVHNYSMLARGPPLKLGSANEGSIDGEPTLRPESPSSPVPVVAANVSTDSLHPVVTNKRKRNSSTLKSHTEVVEKPLSSKSAMVAKANSSDVIKTSSKGITHSTSSSSKDKDKSARDDVNNRLSSNSSDSSTPKTSVNRKSDSSSKSTLVEKSHPLNFLVELKPTIDVAQQQNIDETPGKRLRKPSFKRFSAEEGYVDIFSSRKTRKTATPTKDPPSFDFIKPVNDLSPKPHIQRSRTKNFLNLPRKSKDPESRIPVLVLESTKVDLSQPPSKILENTKTVSVNCDTAKSKMEEESTAAKTVELNHSSQSIISDISSEEEELLDIGEYTIVNQYSQPKKKSPAAKLTSNSLVSPGITKCYSLSPSKKKDSLPTESFNSQSPSKKPKKVTGIKETVIQSVPLVDEEKLSHSTRTVADAADLINTLDAHVKSEPLISPQLRRTGRGRRLTVNKAENSVLDKLKSTPAVLLNRCPIPAPQLVAVKCDNVLPFVIPVTSSSSPPKADMPIQPDGTENKMDTLDIETKTVETSANHFRHEATWKRKKKWGDNKHKWKKSRQKGGLFGKLKLGMRRNDSLSMHLLKRSRLQRRFDKPERPKVGLLTGITKKKMKRIQESIRRRKVLKKKMTAQTKYKDVKVDIINCICGRTDEFGLMVQCEVCLCWQHGGCFNINDSSRLPKFYVCQSCKSPEHVWPSSSVEAIRQESYKKGILPAYPGTEARSPEKQKVVKTCNDLSKMMHSIDDAIRQNRIKEVIVTSEKDHPKLYKWCSPRAVPKDQIQKWHFNKYYKTVLRRLMRRFNKEPGYANKLENTVTFRDKLKKYTHAFEEARQAIRRKIGPRGLILIEKLSEHQRKIKKIEKAKSVYEQQFPGKASNRYPSNLNGIAAGYKDTSYEVMAQMDAQNSVDPSTGDSVNSVANELERLSHNSEADLEETSEEKIDMEELITENPESASPKNAIDLLHDTSYEVTAQMDDQNSVEPSTKDRVISVANNSEANLEKISDDKEKDLEEIVTKNPESASPEDATNLLHNSSYEVTAQMDSKSSVEPSTSDRVNSVANELERLSRNSSADLEEASDDKESDLEEIMSENPESASPEDVINLLQTPTEDSNSLSAATIEKDELVNLHKELCESIRKAVIKQTAYKKVSLMVAKRKAQIIAKATGRKVCQPICPTETRPAKYLFEIKSEYVDALLPYATYFISRFTKKDELSKAKKAWIEEMIVNFVKVQKSLKKMLGTLNEEKRVKKEDKFYAALDNLRKSFDIVLTKKDIKMRRQNNSEFVTPGLNGIKSDVLKAMGTPVPVIPTSSLVNGDGGEEFLTALESPEKIPPETVDVCMENPCDNTTVVKIQSDDQLHPNGNSPKPAENLLTKSGEETDSNISMQVEEVSLVTKPDLECHIGSGERVVKADADINQISDLELLAGLSLKYGALPINDEDVSALLRITRKNCDEKDSILENKVDEKATESTTEGKLTNGYSNANAEDPMDLDVSNDLKLLEENLAPSSENLVLGGDFDLFSAIGSMGGASDLKDTEDSELLLNVFGDPVFSEPQEPCCSKSLTDNQPSQLPTPVVPLLTKLTPEICKGYLIDDIKAHQQVIDVHLDRLEADIMELERKRGRGLREKGHEERFKILHSKMETLVHNLDVLDRMAERSIGEDDSEDEEELIDMDDDLEDEETLFTPIFPENDDTELSDPDEDEDDPDDFHLDRSSNSDTEEEDDDFDQMDIDVKQMDVETDSSSSSDDEASSAKQRFRPIISTVPT